MSLIPKTATEIVSLLRNNTVSPLDLLDELEKRIAQVDPVVNALPTLCFERARENAKQLMQKSVEQRGCLCGLPVAVKDLDPVAGVRTTWGSPVYKDFVPTASDCMVDVIEANGGIVYAKTNTPEFGAGANTFNEVFGATVNPWNTSKSCAGSSGGSAVALATGMAWLATGSDLGGSLRNPASFCSIVGFRPSPGRVAHGPSAPGAYPADMGGMPNTPFSVSGPMARNVPDLALFLEGMTGHHPSDTLSMPKERGDYVDAIESGWKPKRVAYSADFGVTPVDPEIARITEQAAQHFADMGATVENAHPDFSDMEEIFQVNRAMAFYVGSKKLLENKRDMLKPELIWNIEKAREVSMDDIERVELLRGKYIQRAVEFFGKYDLLLSPATIVPPYPVEQRFVESCNGVEFSNYVQWLSIAYAITNPGFPAISVPAGFTDDQLPVGLQICAGPRAEARLLCAAAAYEQASGLAQKVPIDPVKG